MPDLNNTDIKFLPGVGPKRAELLKNELGITTYKGLLYYFPYKYIDRSKLYTIKEVTAALPYIQLRGVIIAFSTHGVGTGRRLVATFTDGTGTIELIWFKGINFVMSKYKTHQEYLLFGKPTAYGSQINVVHPDLEPITEDGFEISGGLQPYYNTTEKMKSAFFNSRAILKIMTTIWSSMTSHIVETLPAYVIKEAKVIYLHEALKQIHFPDNVEMLNKAQYRHKFEELFYLQLNILRYAKQKQLKYSGFCFNKIGDYFNNFYKNYLPFELTGAQKRVLREIREDVGSGRQMNRLLQGDVGSGKTLVALMSMLMAVDNGYQACLMAPTEILATQHLESFTNLLRDLGVSVALLTGSTRKKEREELHAALRSGELNLLIGTHALIEDEVVFANLGLVVIDEQHRFGVEQRSKLWQKNEHPPHVLVMTATPIPRTLAMTVYGDLDVSVIDELPPGRKPIITMHHYDAKRAPLYASLRRQLEAGRQIYIVYPLIQESEKIDLKNLEEGYLHIQEIFPEYKVCMVHGKMKAVEKEEQMQQFVSGVANILVATTVIEVGVNVPNATVMVIENAERFGLSQLHQLRGRVGRGGDQSFCILMTPYKLSQDTRKRLEIMVRTCDGFEISEADLRLRGPGDLEGTMQSGVFFDFKLANLAKDGQILQLARDIARKIIADDPMLERNENFVLKTQLAKIFSKKLDFSLIS